ncbi:meiotic nuclear divisions 1-like protein [Nannochloropsis oceanica]
MSLEEKRATILNIYHTGPGLVYNLKEIENLASKLGVVSQSIKDVNQGLVDDGLVEVEKIGSSNIFFAFPGKALAQKRVVAANLEREIANQIVYIVTPMFTYTYIYYKIYIHPEAQIVLCKQAVNRWTDNTFAVKSYLVKKRNMYSKDVDRLLGLTDAFDYLD